MPRAIGKVSDIDSCGLTFSELQELWLGAHPTTGSCFCTREELVAAWAAGRDVVMRLWARGGRRPMAWWEFEAAISYPGYGLERSVLWRANLLNADEKVTLEREWKAEFETAQAPDFTVNEGGGELLKGDCARAAHYAHHDIPRELVKRWTAAARRRRARAQGAASGAPPQKVQRNAPDVASSARGEEGNTGLRPDSNAATAILR